MSQPENFVDDWVRKLGRLLIIINPQYIFYPICNELYSAYTFKLKEARNVIKVKMVVRPNELFN